MKTRKKELLKLLLACGLMMAPLLCHAYTEPKVVINTSAGSSDDRFEEQMIMLSHEISRLQDMTDYLNSESYELRGHIDNLYNNNNLLLNMVYDIVKTIEELHPESAGVSCYRTEELSNYRGTASRISCQS